MEDSHRRRPRTRAFRLADVPVLLIHPPLAKGCEPPAGIARLAGALRGAGLTCRVLDANLEGQLHLLAQAPASVLIDALWSAVEVGHHLQDREPRLADAGDGLQDRAALVIDRDEDCDLRLILHRRPRQ